MECVISKPTFLFFLPFTDFIQQSQNFYMPPTNCIGSTDTIRHLICMFIHCLHIQ